MFCENCGIEMEKAKFCPNCGKEQTAVVVPAASVPIAESAPISSPASAPAAPAAPLPAAPVSAGVSSSPTVTIADDSKKPAPERKYSLRHIVLCLVTAAIMAATAGVFAGLYFSLLWSMK